MSARRDAREAVRAVRARVGAHGVTAGPHGEAWTGSAPVGCSGGRAARGSLRRVQGAASFLCPKLKDHPHPKLSSPESRVPHHSDFLFHKEREFSNQKQP